MAQTNINIRTDEALKASFDQLCQDVGLTVSTAINAFMKQAVLDNRIPLGFRRVPFYSEKNMERIMRAVARMDAGMGKEHELIEVDDE